ncbi:hypothetical protein YC2023_102586 [Brassica napus]
MGGMNEAASLSASQYIEKAFVKRNRNASERDRRKKINSLFSSLRSSLPTLDQSAWRQRSDGPNFIVQLIHNFSISNVLTGLEEDGLLQNEFEALREKMLYEKCENSFM